MRNERYEITENDREMSFDMKETIEPIAPFIPCSKRYRDEVMFPQKLAEANEFIAQYGIPKEIENKRKKRVQEGGFWVKGILCHADDATNTFGLLETKENISEKYYSIQTWQSETLAQLVKSYWGNTIEVHIMPKTKNENENRYDFIATK